MANFFGISRTLTEPSKPKLELQEQAPATQQPWQSTGASKPARSAAAPLSPTERLHILAARGRALIADPTQIRTPADTDAVRAALQTNTRPNGKSAPGPITFQDHVALVKSLEVLAPNLPASEIATQLRQRYYPDDKLFMNIGRENQAQLPDAARNFLDSIPGGDQDVRLSDGETADIAHALVGFDAASNGMPLKARLYTEVGDAIQGVVSALGGTAAGNFNSADARGNKWGFAMHGLTKAGKPKPLSELLLQTAATIVT